MAERETHDPIGILTSMAWERAKGELRSIVAANGTRYSDSRDETGAYKYERVSRPIEEFIKEFEDNEFHL